MTRDCEERERERERVRAMNLVNDCPILILNELKAMCMTSRKMSKYNTTQQVNPLSRIQFCIRLSKSTVHICAIVCNRSLTLENFCIHFSKKPESVDVQNFVYIWHKVTYARENMCCTSSHHHDYLASSLSRESKKRERNFVNLTLNYMCNICFLTTKFSFFKKLQTHTRV